MPCIEPERPHAGEEPERRADGLGLGLAQGARGVAVGLELLALAQGAQIAFAGRERRTGVPVANVAVLVREEERGKARPELLQQDRVVVDDRTAVLEGREGHVTQGVGRDLPHVDQALDGLGPVGPGRQQQRRDDGDDPEPAHRSRSLLVVVSTHNALAAPVRGARASASATPRVRRVSEAFASVESAWALGWRRPDAPYNRSTVLPSSGGLARRLFFPAS